MDEISRKDSVDLNGTSIDRTGSRARSAALIGGGVVFALALVIPALVTLRGACAAYLALRRADEPSA